jgi:hypothetical protein
MAPRTARKILESWFKDFTKFARGRGNEWAEICTDSAREELFNSYAALTLRQYGRKQNKLFWARCEWEDCDITFGIATENLNYECSDYWSRAWEERKDGELGVIEAKLVCMPAKSQGQVTEVRKQLDRLVKDYPTRIGVRVALIYLLEYEPGRESRPLRKRYTESMKKAGFRVVKDFQEVGRRALKKAWPLDTKDEGVLYIGLFALNG